MTVTFSQPRFPRSLRSTKSLFTLPTSSFVHYEVISEVRSNYNLPFTPYLPSAITPKKRNHSSSFMQGRVEVGGRRQNRSRSGFETTKFLDDESKFPFLLLYVSICLHSLRPNDKLLLVEANFFFLCSFCCPFSVPVRRC